MTPFRVVTAILWLILLLLAAPLFGHQTEGGAILNLWGWRYASILGVYVVGMISLAVVIIKVPRRLIDSLLLVIRWVQQRPILIVVLALLLWEGWGRIRMLAEKRQYFESGFLFHLAMLALGLVAVYTLLVTLLAGRQRAEMIDLAGSLALLTVSTGIALVIFSIGYASLIRPGIYIPRHALYAEGSIPDDALGYRLKPDHVIEMSVEGEPVQYVINADGFRGEIHTDAPVAVIGDSFIFGFGLNENLGWEEPLATELNRDVNNYGIFGYDLWQYNVVAERYAVPRPHQLVVYVIFANDLHVPSTAQQIQDWYMKRYSNPIVYTFSELFSQPPSLFVRDMVAAISRKSPAREVPTVEPYQYPATCTAWAAASNLNTLRPDLTRALELAEQGGYQLLVVTIPSRESTYAETFQPICEQDSSKANTIDKERQGYQFVCNYMQNAGTPCYDMSTDFAQVAAEMNKPLYLNEGHWNEAGHQVFADLLGHYIIEHGLLK